MQFPLLKDELLGKSPDDLKKRSQNSDRSDILGIKLFENFKQLYRR
ncbi:MAG: hypothetical protein AB4041_12955 [Microcystaceae cyanobacterium]